MQNSRAQQSKNSYNKLREQEEKIKACQSKAKTKSNQKSNSNTLWNQKLVLQDFFSLNQVTVSNQIITTIPYYYHYFIPINTYRTTTIQQTPEDHRQGQPHRFQAKYLLLTTPKKNTTTFPEHFSGQNTKKHAHDMISSFKYLLKTCKIMNQYKFVHGNICADTVQFNGPIPLLTNFSYSFFLETLDEDRRKMLIQNPNLGIHAFCNNNPMINGELPFLKNIFSREELAQYKESIQRQQDTDTDTSTSTNTSVEKIINIWDIYSLCILYLQLSDFIESMNPEFTKTIFIQKFLNYLKKNIYAFDSLTCDNLMQELETFTNSFKI